MRQCAPSFAYQIYPGATVLPSFEITGFRTFSSLVVPRFGQVNLIVGKNNVGKTMLLEAIRLYVLRGDAMALRSLLLDREEFVNDLAVGDDHEASLRVDSLFHRSPTGEHATKIQLGQAERPNRNLTIGLHLIRRVRRDGQFVGFELVNENEVNDPSIVPGLVIKHGKSESLIPLSYLGEHPRRMRHTPTPIAYPAFVPARGVSDLELARWWDAVALKDAEERVKECLALISPVERINWIEHPGSMRDIRDRRDRIAMVRMRSEPNPVPLKSMGDGMARMFQIALALECARPKLQGNSLFDEGPADYPRDIGTVLLIDEIENGIHYTIHGDMWRFIFKVAKLHDVQVFATSHSWDAIAGLQEAAESMPETDVSMLRLERTARGTNKAVLYNKDELKVATRDHIEAR